MKESESTTERRPWPSVNCGPTRHWRRGEGGDDTGCERAAAQPRLKGKKWAARAWKDGSDHPSGPGTLGEGAGRAFESLDASR